MQYQAPRGTVDILPEDQVYWDRVKAAARVVTQQFGYRQIDTPTFEDAGLFVRGIGEGTDIVEKEMYTFEDRGGSLITLRPEGTASVCRAYLQHGMHALPQPVRLFYITPIFRYERPQAGRFRQHWQFGCEAIGDPDPVVDAETIQLAWAYFGELGFSDLTLYVNSIGSRQGREKYLERLVDFYNPKMDSICNDCRVRLKKNPLRLLDCKQESCQPFIEDAPHVTDYLDADSQEHFDDVRRYLELSEIPFTLNHRLVRGLDYYAHTVFEIFPKQEGSQSAMAGGGRYDGLIEQIGGNSVPAVGFGSGIERAVLELKQQENPDTYSEQIDAFIAYLGSPAKNAAVWLLGALRKHNVSAQIATGSRSLRAQLRTANQINARFAIIIGDDELSGSQIDEVKPVVRDLASGEQNSMTVEALIQRISMK